MSRRNVDAVFEIIFFRLMIFYVFRTSNKHLEWLHSYIREKKTSIRRKSKCKKVYLIAFTKENKCVNTEMVERKKKIHIAILSPTSDIEIIGQFSYKKKIRIAFIVALHNCTSAQ